MGFSPQMMSLAATAGSSVAGAMSSQNAASYQSAVARNNQTIADYNARLATFQGQQSEQIAREKTAQMIGAQRAGFGAANIDVNSGSALRTQADTARLGEMDAQTIAANAARSAWNYQVQGQSDAAQAQMDIAAGRNNAFSSLLSGGGQFADKWNKYTSQGWTPS